MTNILPPHISLATQKTIDMLYVGDDKMVAFFNKLTGDKETLSFNAFYNKLKEKNVTLSKQEIKKQWDIIDVDKSDGLDVDEFQALMKRRFGIDDPKRIVQEAFQSIYESTTNDGSGSISPTVKSAKVNFNVAVPINARTLKQKKMEKQEWDETLSFVFQQIDVDGSGTIDEDEMWEAIQLLELGLTKQQLKQCMKFFDTDRNGTIDELEFKRWMNSQITQFWEGGTNNKFVKLQRALKDQDKLRRLKSLSTKGTDEAKFTFDAEHAKLQPKKKSAHIGKVSMHVIDMDITKFFNCDVTDVLKFDVNTVGDYINFMFDGNEYAQHRNKYVSIFMANNVDGTKLLTLDRRKIARLGVENQKGKRHCTVIWNEIRQIKKRSMQKQS